MMNKIFHARGKTFQPDKREACAKCVLQVNTLWKFACNFSTFFKVSRKEFFLENR